MVFFVDAPFERESSIYRCPLFKLVQHRSSFRSTIFSSFAISFMNHSMGILPYTTIFSFKLIMLEAKYCTMTKIVAAIPDILPHHRHTAWHVHCFAFAHLSCASAVGWVPFSQQQHICPLMHLSLQARMAIVLLGRGNAHPLIPHSSKPSFHPFKGLSAK